MSYVALATDAFDAVTTFYGHDLGFPVVEEWIGPPAAAGGSTCWGYGWKSWTTRASAVP